MEIYVHSNLKPYSIRIRRELEILLVERGHNLNEESPELVISVGGDGTLLHAFHKYIDLLDSVKFVGIHTGSLGFYTDFTTCEIPDLLDKLDDGPIKVTKAPLLDIKIFHENITEEFMALNDMTVINAKRTLFVDVYVDDRKFESYRGTGLCICTPTGSTGYNKSLSGSVISPKLEAFQLTEMAPINSNTYRSLGSPMVLGRGEKLNLYIGHSVGITITVDHVHRSYDELTYIECKLSDKYIMFANYKERSFYERVQRAFLDE